MNTLNRRLERLEQSRTASGPDIYLLQWNDEVTVTRAVYNGIEYFRNEGETFDAFQERVSDEIRGLPFDGPLRVVCVWMDSATRQQMSTEDTVTYAVLDHGKGGR